jgi:predicted O-linked N-acetylglucosamine transferase (SPINDLY family)
MAAPLEVDALLAKAMNAHQAGQLHAAQALYRAALKKVPKHPVALHFLGISQIQEGRAEKGIELVREALKRSPDYIEAHYNLACALQAIRRLDEAAEHYRKVLTVKPNNAQAHNNFGALLLEQKRFSEAINHFEQALGTNRNNPQTHSNIGVALSELRQYDLAIRHFEQSLAINPGNVEVLCNLGNALEKSNRHEEALAIYNEAASLQPNNADASCGQGNVLASTGHRQAALAAFEQALELNSGLAEAWLGQGNVLSELNLEASLAAYGNALKLKPQLAEAWRGCGYVYEMLARYQDAVAAYDRALAYTPDLKYTKGQWLFAKMRNCDWNESQSNISRLLTELKDGNPVASPFIVSVLSSSLAEQQACAQQYVSREHPASKKPLWQGERYSHDRIRIAYVSADFREHATSRLIAGVFEHHDLVQFETVAISFGPDDGSAMHSRLTKAFDEFIDVGAKSHREIASLMRDREIDIAVDLMGLTVGARFNVFAMRPAPVQVNYLAYPGTLGASYVDYIIADEIVIPRDQRLLYSEKVAYLPHSYQANDAARPQPDTTPSRQAVGLPEAGFVFCSFNNSYKITPDMFDIWMRLLQQVDGSVLWLLERSSSASENLRREAQHRGVSPERVIFAPHTRLEDHLARQRLADLFLDTLPCNAHTTASEALWVGLPVLTCLGSTFVGRVAASLLTAIGLPEQIVYSMRDYEDRALALARDPALLASVKSKLAQNRATHPLFDTARFTRDIEALYVAMWQRSQQGRSPMALPGTDA